MSTYPSEEFEDICTWIGQSKAKGDGVFVGSDQWCHDLRSKISAAKKQLSESELYSLNYTLDTMRATYNRSRAF